MLSRHNQTKARNKTIAQARRLTDVTPAGDHSVSVKAAEGQRFLLEWDVSWSHALAKARNFADDPPSSDEEGNPSLGKWAAGNPYCCYLFVELEPAAVGLPKDTPPWRLARQSLLAYCVAKQGRAFFADRA